MSTAALYAIASAITVLAAFYPVVTRRQTYQSGMPVYCDDDGDASADETTEKRDRILKWVISVVTLGVLALSMINTTISDLDTRLVVITSGWIVVNIEATFLTLETSSRQRFSIGLLVAFSSLVLSSALLVGDHSDFEHQIVYWSQFVLGLCLPVASCSLPRRPTVYLEGRAVDGQLTCSAISRFTFAWVRPLLDRARKQHPIEYDDLPALGHATRSRSLEERFPSMEAEKVPLWRCIVRDHHAAIFQQWFVAILESIVSILPPVCMYKILSLLEKRSLEQLTDRSAIWFWAICLAASKVAHVGLSNWLQWVSFALFAMPVRSQLSAVIFAKSLRLKLIQDNSSQSTSSLSSRASLDSENGKGEDNETDRLLPQEEADQEDQASIKREIDHGVVKGVINLLGVDVQRVAEFCGYNIDLLRGAVKVTAAALLLTTLIGWQSTLAGFAVPVILQPLNRIATKHYTKRQLEVMAARDNKAHIVTEALHGIRQIKFSATESEWERRIMAARERELQAQWSVYVWAIFLTFTWVAMPALIGAAALSVYAWLSKQMIPSVAFTSLAVFSSLEWTISAVPTTITEMLDAVVSANRIQQHIDSEERVGVLKEGDGVVFKDASIAWPSESWSSQGCVLQALNLRFPPDQLSVIRGKTGTGKSLLLAAIIGEADVITGEIQSPRASPMAERNSENVSLDDWIIPAAFAYVGQVPWIENTSVKETILYGLPYRRDRYMRVIHACALTEDIRMLPDGEDTEVGATGINLSGGQRWRLTFARALYSRAGILVLDDIFSAVDSHVGRHLLNHGILGPLGANRTKILVTHHVGLVQRHAAYIVTLNSDGTASTGANLKPETPLTAAVTSNWSQPSQSTSSFETNNDDEAHDFTKPKARKFVEDEGREQGRVKWTVYKTYLLASGGRRYWALTFIIFSLAALSVVARSYWLTLWTKTYTTDRMLRADTTDHTVEEKPSQPHLLFYLGIYILISMVSISLVGVKIIFVLVASLRAARHLFEAVTLNVLRAQLRWLDTQPIGRVLNRFVGDFALIDSKLGGDMTWCANGLFSIVTIIVAALFVSGWMLVPVTVLSLLCVYVVYLYLDAARDIKRLESSAKSPIFELVGSTLSGLATIRSFGRIDDYLDRMYANIDRYAQASWYVLLATQWMRMRQGVLGVLFTLCIAIGVASFPVIDASLAGFALSFALDFSAVVENTVSRYTSTELDMNSTERVSEYMHIATETCSGADAALSWPSKGKINVRDLEVRYSKDLGPVLKGISFSVQPCQRIGIVGRTGSGKSSLTLALFRFLEAHQGSIEIDDVDISSLKLHDVRSRLAIIPQDPVLFSGTLRSNLDPFDQHSDSTLLGALGRVTSALNLSGGTLGRSNIFKDLSTSINRCGANLSQGEKQLVCLARAIISRPKIMVLDEATSAVDMATDASIQRSIRKEFQNSTLLVVAHRLSTVADFDKILVMSDGKVAEYDQPKVLARKRGLFWKMLCESGEKDALEHLLA